MRVNPSALLAYARAVVVLAWAGSLAPGLIGMAAVVVALTVGTVCLDAATVAIATDHLSAAQALLAVGNVAAMIGTPIFIVSTALLFLGLVRWVQRSVR